MIVGDDISCDVCMCALESLPHDRFECLALACGHLSHLCGPCVTAARASGADPDALVMVARNAHRERCCSACHALGAEGDGFGHANDCPIRIGAERAAADTAEMLGADAPLAPDPAAFLAALATSEDPLVAAVARHPQIGDLLEEPRPEIVRVTPAEVSRLGLYAVCGLVPGRGNNHDHVRDREACEWGVSRAEYDAAIARNPVMIAAERQARADAYPPLPFKGYPEIPKTVSALPDKPQRAIPIATLGGGARMFIRASTDPTPDTLTRHLQDQADALAYGAQHLSKETPAVPTKLRVYVAASGTDLERAARWMEALRRAGVEVVSTWVENVLKWGGVSNPVDQPEAHRALADAQAAEVVRADILWLLMPPSSSHGALWELGRADALGKATVVSGAGVARSIFTARALRFEDDLDAFADVLACSLRPLRRVHVNMPIVEAFDAAAHVRQRPAWRHTGPASECPECHGGPIDCAKASGPFCATCGRHA